MIVLRSQDSQLGLSSEDDGYVKVPHIKISHANLSWSVAVLLGRFGPRWITS